MNIIPTPKKIITKEGKIVLNHISTDIAEWKDLLHGFCKYCKNAYGIEFTNTCSGVTLVYKSGLKKGGYEIDGDKLFASDREGAGNALSTLFQIITCDGGDTYIQNLSIIDYPDKPYRGLMVDLARRRHNFNTLLHYVDLCFINKVNYLHLHFIDDQSYTLPSSAFPLLSTQGKSYTHEEIKILNKYAKERNVTIIPEFEAPGHAKALIDGYTEIFANHLTGENEEISVTENGAFITGKNILCAGSEKAMKAIEILLGEISDMFPNSPYIHIGGDEANIKTWENCSVCSEYMKKNNISDVYELYSDFIARVAKIVLKLGKTPIVWEGFPKKGADKIPKETIVIAWESHYHMPYELIDEGFGIINASWQPLYIVPSTEQRWSPKDIMKWNVYNWQHWWENSEAYLNPINVAPTEKVIGAQLCAWECTYEQEINFVMENIAALSERTWSVKSHCNDEEFLCKHRKLMEKAANLIQER